MKCPKDRVDVLLSTLETLKKMNVLELVSRRRAPAILIALSRRPYHVRELTKAVGGSSSTVVKRIRELSDAGLIRVVEIPGFPFRKKVLITDKGRQVAICLAHLMAILSNSTLTFLEREKNNAGLGEDG